MLRLLVIASIGHRGHHREGGGFKVEQEHIVDASLIPEPRDVSVPKSKTTPTAARLSKINDKISIRKESICDPHSFVWDIKVIMVAQYFDLANLAVVWHQK